MFHVCAIPALILYLCTTQFVTKIKQYTSSHEHLIHIYPNKTLTLGTIFIRKMRAHRALKNSSIGFI